MDLFLCLADGCKNETKVKSLCVLHYKQVRRGIIAPIEGSSATANPPCSTTGCGRPAESIKSGLCHNHNITMRATGDTVVKYMRNKGLTCCEEGCSEAARALGLCYNHYAAANYSPPAKKVWPECAFGGCVMDCRSKTGFCGPHGRQDRNFGYMWPLNEERPMRPTYECSIPSCTETGGTKENWLCRSHGSRARRHNLSVERMVELFTDAQCMACGATDALCIDHDHACCSSHGGRSCGECVRGLLCSGCNTALGLLGESLDRILGLLSYLDSLPVAA